MVVRQEPQYGSRCISGVKPANRQADNVWYVTTGVTEAQLVGLLEYACQKQRILRPRELIGGAVHHGVMPDGVNYGTR